MHQTVLKADVRIKRKRCFKFRIESKITLHTCCPVLDSHLSHLSCFVVNLISLAWADRLFLPSSAQCGYGVCGISAQIVPAQIMNIGRCGRKRYTESRARSIVHDRLPRLGRISLSTQVSKGPPTTILEYYASFKEKVGLSIIRPFQPVVVLELLACPELHII